jgi:hypothetical protein
MAKLWFEFIKAIVVCVWFLLYPFFYFFIVLFFFYGIIKIFNL